MSFSNTSDLAGAEKLNFGLSLVDKAGCNGCHHNEDWPTQAKSGPNPKKVNEKLSEDWVSKWVKKTLVTLGTILECLQFLNNQIKKLLK